MDKRTTTIAAALTAAALAAGAPAWAAPDDDYQRGREAFLQGNMVDAIGLLRSASAKGHTQAQTLLAYILDIAEEDAEARRLYLEAAERGNAEAMYGLASMYASGEGGDRDDAQALRWFTAAMEAGHGHATLALADAYLNGKLGLEPDRERALELLRLGAERGYEPARDRLARLTSKKQ